MSASRSLGPTGHLGRSPVPTVRLGAKKPGSLSPPVDPPLGGTDLLALPVSGRVCSGGQREPQAEREADVPRGRCQCPGATHLGFRWPPGAPRRCGFALMSRLQTGFLGPPKRSLSADDVHPLYRHDLSLAHGRRADFSSWMANFTVVAPTVSWWGLASVKCTADAQGKESAVPAAHCSRPSALPRGRGSRSRCRCPEGHIFGALHLRTA